MIRVLIADDHVLVRNGMRKLCEMMGDIIVTGEAANGDEVLHLLDASQFDIILLDMNMSGFSGVGLIEHILARDTKLPILVHSMCNDPLVVKRVLRAGASGYVAKGSGQDILMSAICKVAIGERFVDPNIVEAMMFGSLERSKPALRERLSERER